MKRLLIAMAMLALVALPLGAQAHDPNPNASCSGLGDEAELVVNDPADLGVGLYVDLERDHSRSPESPGLWTESNGTGGLQTHSHLCKDGVTVEADTRLA